MIQGQAYQEVFTNFPLGSQLVTGLFLDISLSGPQGPATTLEKTLLDREGYAARVRRDDSIRRDIIYEPRLF